MILQDSLTLTLAGLTAGLPLSMLLGHALASLLYDVRPLDGWSYLAAVGGIAAITIAASAVPAGRAASVDPLAALRME